MNDDFLHRLRKDPPPEFTARLREQLRLQPAPSPRRRTPSLLRNFVTVLLLGGAAFAVTSLVISGLPDSLLEWYQHSAGLIRAEPAPTPAPQTGRYGSRAMRPFDPAALGPPGGAAAPGRSAQSAVPAPNRASAAGTTNSAPSAASRIVGGAPGPQKAQITVAASWAAYPYVAPIADDINRARGAPAIRGPNVSVSARDSSRWPGPMCEGGTDAPSMGYSFEPAGTVSRQPCPPGAVGHSRSVIAIPSGYEAVVLARSPIYGAPDLTRREIFLALAKWVPDPRGRTVHENSSTTWRQVDGALESEPIKLLGPPLSSPAGHSMIELLLEGGCRTIPWIAALESTDPARYDRLCRTVRTDGVYVEVPWLAPTKLLSEPNAIGIFGLWSLANVRVNDLVMSRLDGVEPTAQAIESGTYPGSRALYLYISPERAPPNIVVRFMVDNGYGWPRSSDSAFIPPSQSDVQAAIAGIPGP